MSGVSRGISASGDGRMPITGRPAALSMMALVVGVLIGRVFRRR